MNETSSKNTVIIKPENRIFHFHNKYESPAVQNMFNACQLLNREPKIEDIPDIFLTTICINDEAIMDVEMIYGARTMYIRPLDSSNKPFVLTFITELTQHKFPVNCDIPDGETFKHFKYSDELMDRIICDKIGEIANFPGILLRACNNSVPILSHANYPIGYENVTEKEKLQLSSLYGRFGCEIKDNHTIAKIVIDEPCMIPDEMSIGIGQKINTSPEIKEFEALMADWKAYMKPYDDMLHTATDEASEEEEEDVSNVTELRTVLRTDTGDVPGCFYIKNGDWYFIPDNKDDKGYVFRNVELKNINGIDSPTSFNLTWQANTNFSKQVSDYADAYLDRLKIFTDSAINLKKEE